MVIRLRFVLNTYLPFLVLTVHNETKYQICKIFIQIYPFSNSRSNARKYNKNKKEEKLTEAAIEKKLQPKQRAQKEMIIEGVLDVIFKAAGGENGIFCIPGDKNCFEPTQRYLSDTITEKVIFVFHNMIQISFVQLNLFQKHSFLHQLTQNMKSDCSLNHEFSKYKKTTSSVVQVLYIKLF